MALYGRYTTIDVVLDKLYLRSKLSISEDDAVIWLADMLTMLSRHAVLFPYITDGNADLGHEDPIEVVNYRAKLPCDEILVTSVFELSTFTNLRASFSNTHIMNFTGNTNFDMYKHYNPNFWNNHGISNSQRGAYNNPGFTLNNGYIPKQDYAFINSNNLINSSGSPQSIQIKRGYIFTDFKEGHLIVCYLGYPKDENGLLLIPADAEIVNLASLFLQEKLDYSLWRNGSIPDKVYKDTQTQLHWAQGVAQELCDTMSEAEMQSSINMSGQLLQGQDHYVNSFKSLGSKQSLRLK